MDDSLSFESFLEGAQKAAHRAMEDHGREEYDEFALHGGVAVERLAKAVLVSKSPAYLVEMRNGPADMLLYFGGHLEMATDKVRTVGAKEALTRLRRMKVLPQDEQLDQLIDLRNGTAHTAVGDEAKTLLPTLADTIQLLLIDVRVPVQQFWGRWTSAIGEAVNKQQGEVQRDVSIRIKQARHLFEDRFKGLPKGAKERLLKEHQPSSIVEIGTISFTSKDNKLKAVIGTTACPACGCRAKLVLRAVTLDDAVDDFTASSLACPLCGLKLHGSAEIKASGADIEKAIIPTSIALKQRAGSPDEVTEIYDI